MEVCRRSLDRPFRETIICHPFLPVRRVVIQGVWLDPNYPSLLSPTREDPPTVLSPDDTDGDQSRIKQWFVRPFFRSLVLECWGGKVVLRHTVLKSHTRPNVFPSFTDSGYLTYPTPVGHLRLRGYSMLSPTTIVRPSKFDWTT